MNDIAPSGMYHNKRKSKPRVLIVDDEPDVTTPFRRAFEAHDYEVDVFNDPVKAALDFKPDHYDACIIDFRMPEKSGLELARHIWQLDEKVQVCYLSSFEIYENEAKKVFNDLKSHCFIRKPMLPSALVAHVEKHFML